MDIVNLLPNVPGRAIPPALPPQLLQRSCCRKGRPFSRRAKWVDLRSLLLDQIRREMAARIGPRMIPVHVATRPLPVSRQRLEW